MRVWRKRKLRFGNAPIRVEQRFTHHPNIVN